MERRATEPRKRRLILAGVVTVTLLSPLAAVAQHTASSEGGTPRSVVTLADVHRYPALDLNLPPVFSKGTHQSSVLDRAPRSLSQSNATSDRRSKTRAFLGAVVGATGGFFAGGYTGAWIEGDRCHCDDPGLTGALIGAPIGALVGGILGGFFLF